MRRPRTSLLAERLISYSILSGGWVRLASRVIILALGCFALATDGRATTVNLDFAVESIPPFIITHPQSVVVAQGSTAAFSATAGGEPAPYANWQLSTNGGAFWQTMTDIYPYSGTSTNTLGIVFSNYTMSGYQYRCVFTHPGTGSATTNPATLTVQSPPVVPGGGGTMGLFVGETANFSIGAGGTPPFTYQWQRNGVDIPGATSATYSLSNVQLSDNNSQFRTVVTNAFGSVISSPTTLQVTVEVPLSITVQPQSQTTYIGSNLALSVSAEASRALSYQWRKNGVDIPNTNGPALIFDNVQLADAGDYSVVVRTSVHSITSAVATVTVINNPTVIGVSSGLNHTLILASNGALWGMGTNGWGELGLGGTSDTIVPVLLTSNVTGLAAGRSHSLFVKSDFSLWATGFSMYGQLGDGSNQQRRTTPIQVASDVLRAAGGGNFSLHLKRNLTLWATGENNRGQLGLGDTTGRNTWTQVASQVAEIAAGRAHAVFVKTDGTLWAMGDNTDGQLGDGTTTERRSPVQVATGVARVFSNSNNDTLFIKTDGTLWGMGLNGWGELGDGSTLSRQSPVFIANGVTTAAVGDGHALFIKTDGTLWAMGANGYGQLGIGSTVSSLVPVQVSTNAIAVSAGGTFSTFVKTDGSYWGMGTNGLPRVLGLPVGTYPSPTRILNMPDASPVITGHPLGLVIEPEAVAHFNITASGTPTPTYQWQLQAAGSGTWSNLGNAGVYSGATSASLGITGATLAMNGDQFRCIVTNSVGSATSRVATLTVVRAPTIMAQPISATVLVGHNAGFTVNLGEAPNLQYYWQVSEPGSTGWTDLTNGGIYSGVNTATLAITGATTGLDGNVYRCVIFNPGGHAVSEWARLTVTAPAVPPIVGAHPANKTVTTGESTSFTVGVGGTPTLLYYWQVSAPGSTSWTDLVNGGVYSGVNTATLAVTGATTGLDGNVYRCVIFNPAGHAVSDWARLTVGSALTAPTVTDQPASSTVAAGANASFTVGVSGSPTLLYYWQVSAPGSTSWTDLTNGAFYIGVNTATLTITGAPAGLDGNVYRCVIFNDAGHAISDWARLTVTGVPTSPMNGISHGGHTFPSQITGGAYVNFAYTVTNSGTKVWGANHNLVLRNSSGVQLASASLNGVAIGGTTTVNMLIAAPSTPGIYGYSMQAQESGVGFGSPVALSLTTTPPDLRIVTHPQSVSVPDGNGAQFTVVAVGVGPFTFRWQSAAPGSDTWTTEGMDHGPYEVIGITTPEGTFTGQVLNTGSHANATTNGRRYRCIVITPQGSVTSNEAVLTVTGIGITPPAIAIAPADTSVNVGETAMLNVFATGSAPLTYQWQVQAFGSESWQNLSYDSTYSATNTLALRIVGSAAVHRHKYRCIASNAAGSVTSRAAVLTVLGLPQPPTVTGQPSSVTVAASANASFTVGVSGSPTLLYYWQVSALGSTSWTDLVNGGVYSGVNTATLVIAGATAGMNGNAYRCVIFNDAGHAVSDWARLTVGSALTAPTVTGQPSSATVAASANASFTVGVSGTPTLLYYWQVSALGSTSWTDLVNGGSYGGVNTATLTISGAVAGLNGNVYRCVIFNDAGHAVSDWARLTVGSALTAPTVTGQPSSATVAASANASFTVGVSGTPTLLYYWQVSALGSTSWTDLVNGGVYSGVNTATLVITGATAGMNGNAYRCVIFNDAGHAVSGWAQLTVGNALTAPTVTTQPASTSVATGTNASFTVGVSGTPTLLYYWQVSAPGSTSWTDLVNGGVYSGVNTGTLVITGATAGMGGNAYRCVVFNDAGHAVSGWAQLTVGNALSAPMVTGQPSSLTVAASANASFTVGVSGTPTLLYYWQVSALGSTSWTDLVNGGVYSGVNTATLVITGATAGMNGNAYRCVIFNDAGHAVSGWAQLTVASGSLSGQSSAPTEAMPSGGSTNPQPIDPNTVTRSPLSVSGFAAWQQTKFSAIELTNPLISGPDAIYGTDGLANLTKYGLGLDPKVNEPGALGETHAGDTEWTFVYPRPTGITDVIFSVEVSADLTHWTATGVAHERVSASGGWELWQARYPRTAGQGMVFRIVVIRR